MAPSSLLSKHHGLLTRTRSGWIRGAIVALGMALAPMSVVGAEFHFSDDQIALSSGAMRLAALRTGGISVAEAGVARELLSRMGYGLSVPAVVRYDLRFSPVLTYDPNINGGFADAAVTLGGLDFTLDPELAARSGWVAGLRFSGSLLAGLDRRLALDASFAASYARGLSDPAEKSDGMLRLCLRRFAGEARELRACLDGSFSLNESGYSHRRGAELGLSHAFAVGHILGEASGWLRHEIVHSTERHDQWQVGSKLALAFEGDLRLDLGFSLGERVAESIAMRERLSFGLTTHLWERPAQISLAVEQRRGGTFLGTPRDELAMTLALRSGVEVPFGQRSVQADVGITLSQIQARHAVLEQGGMTVDISFRF